MTFRRTVAGIAFAGIMAGGFAKAYANPIVEGPDKERATVQHSARTDNSHMGNETTKITEANGNLPPAVMGIIGKRILDSIIGLKFVMIDYAGAMPGDEINVRVWFAVENGVVRINNINLYSPNAPGGCMEPSRINLGGIRFDSAVNGDGNVRVHIPSNNP